MKRNKTSHQIKKNNGNGVEGKKNQKKYIISAIC